MHADRDHHHSDATAVDAPESPILLLHDGGKRHQEWQQHLSGIQECVFSADNLSEALLVLQECENLGTPAGAVVILAIEWGPATQRAVVAMREKHTESELPILVACDRWDRDALVEALVAGVNLTLSPPWDWEYAGLQIRRHLLLSQQTWSLSAEKSQAVDLLAQHKQSSMSQDLWRLDLGSRTIDFSENCGDLIGFHPSEIGTRLDDWLNLIHPRDLQRLSDALSITDWATAPEDLNFEFRLRHRTGAWRWVLMRGRMERDELGLPVCLIGSHTDITQAKTTDSITGLANRFQFEDWLHGRLLEQAAICVFLVGIDRYALIRDSLGQTLGDQLLRLTGERLDGLKDQAGGGIVARLSGDEFGIAISGAVEDETARQIADDMRQSLSKGIWLDGKQLFVSTSIGFVLRGDRDSYSELWRDAEIAMHSAKAAGGNRIVAFDHSMRAKVIEQMELDNDLKRAMEEWQFEVFYQPKVALKDERIIGFEALLRWRHPTRGIVPPSAFIPLAEANGLIVPIGIRTVREACLTIRKWQDEFPQDPILDVSVNLSVRQFQDRHLIEEIRKILAETAIPPATLQFEVTESVLVDDPLQALEIVEELRRMGVGLKIDDFGTGYSSLSYLHRLPFDTLKIDRSFVSTMGQDHTAYEIVRAIISLAQSLGLQVVAEGVETRSQAEELRKLGCGYAQGYLFAPPLTDEAAHRMLTAQAGKDLAARAVVLQSCA